VFHVRNPHAGSLAPPRRTRGQIRLPLTGASEAKQSPGVPERRGARANPPGAPRPPRRAARRIPDEQQNTPATTIGRVRFSATPWAR